ALAVRSAAVERVGREVVVVPAGAARGRAGAAVGDGELRDPADLAAVGLGPDLLAPRDVRAVHVRREHLDDVAADLTLRARDQITREAGATERAGDLLDDGVEGRREVRLADRLDDGVAARGLE